MDSLKERLRDDATGWEASHSGLSGRDTAALEREAASELDRLGAQVEELKRERDELRRRIAGQDKLIDAYREDEAQIEALRRVLSELVRIDASAVEHRVNLLYQPGSAADLAWQAARAALAAPEAKG